MAKRRTKRTAKRRRLQKKAKENTLEAAISTDLIVESLTFLSLPTACSLMPTSHRFSDLLKKSLLRKTTLASTRAHYNCDEIPHGDITKALCALCPNLEVIEDRHHKFARYEFSSEQILRMLQHLPKLRWYPAPTIYEGTVDFTPGQIKGAKLNNFPKHLAVTNLSFEIPKKPTRSDLRVLNAFVRRCSNLLHLRVRCLEESDTSGVLRAIGKIESLVSLDCVDLLSLADFEKVHVLFSNLTALHFSPLPTGCEVNADVVQRFAAAFGERLETLSFSKCEDCSRFMDLFLSEMHDMEDEFPALTDLHIRTNRTDIHPDEIYERMDAFLDGDLYPKYLKYIMLWDNWPHRDGKVLQDRRDYFDQQEGELHELYPGTEFEILIYNETLQWNGYIIAGDIQHW